MTRLVNSQINSMVQVVDSNGDKATEAIVNFKVYHYDGEDEEWEIVESGLMTHIGDGIFQASFSPEQTGEYTFYAYSTNPKFHESYTYFVENQEANGGAAFYGNVNYNASPPTQGELVELGTWLNGFKGYFFRFWQSNTEAAAKTITFNLQNDNSGGDYQASCPSGHMMYLYWDQFYGMFKIYDQDAAGGPPYMMGPTMYDNSNKVLVTNPLECKKFIIKVTFEDPAGTNQILQVYFSLAEGGMFLNHHDPPEED